MNWLRMFIFSITLIAVGASAQPAAAGVDDFTFSSFDATYTLAKDADGRSTLDVVETLVAEFPESDQNRGIRRELVDTYDGHPTDLEVVSVTDESGTPRPYEIESESDITILTIAGDDFVRGTQAYVITYRQHNVTRYFADTDRDEFYWDTNGTGWRQPFARVTATVVIDPALRAALTDDVVAVEGSEGSTTPARVDATGTGFEAVATDLAPRENLSFSVGFRPGTFVRRDDSFSSEPWPLIATLGATGVLATLVAAIILRRRRLRDSPGRGIIVPEYLPPKGVSPLLASVILRKTARALTAQILHLAVVGNIRVVEIEQKRRPGYRLDYLTSERTDADGLGFLHALFGAELTPGETRTLAKSDPKAVARLTKLTTAVAHRATTDGFRRRLPVGQIALIVAASLTSIVACYIFSIVALDRAIAVPIMLLTLVVSTVGVVATIALIARRPLEAKGVELREYLEGLRMYMSLAEADRMRMLQSPVGALRSPLSGLPVLGPDSPDAVGQHVLLNERLLPYAVLFGLEKQWAEEIAITYENAHAHPGWYVGASSFNPALFASGIGSVATAVTSSYSSAGGSGGGASSGGGGGGGGGGGV